MEAIVCSMGRRLKDWGGDVVEGRSPWHVGDVGRMGEARASLASAIGNARGARSGNTVDRGRAAHA